MEKRVKILKILRGVWLALGLAAMFYVMFFYKKSAWPVALVFLAVFFAIELPLRRAEQALGGDKPDDAGKD